MIDLKSKPFYLSDEDIAWVESTLSAMTLEERIGQLFCPISYSKDPGYLGNLLDTYHVGGILFRQSHGDEIMAAHRFLQSHSKIPLLLAANMETGGVGIASNGTFFGSQMQVAATGDPQMAYKLGSIAGAEGAAVGLNWAFAPICDIDMNYYNPITNTRTYGADPERVLSMALQCQRALKDKGIAASIKHFPGDGVDDRDQHLLVSVNRLSRESWDATFGKVYQGLIDDGVPAVMAGHIALPAYQGKPGRPVPATLSSELLNGLLRGKLGFNGLIVTDATPMIGFGSAMARAQAVPTCIAAGCDVFLFNRDLDEDFGYMMQGYHDGVLTEARLQEAVTRILALKASIGLHKKQHAGTLVPGPDALQILACDTHMVMARDCADRSVTLVKDVKGLLPMSPAKTRRILLQILGDFPSNARVLATAVARLETAGFAVTVYQKEDLATLEKSVEGFKAKYDTVLYLANIETASNKTVNRIHWHTMFGMGNNIPWFAEELPVVFVSLGNPYHLLDVPMIGTYINCYSNNDSVIHAAIDKLLGQSAFKGTSPIDPFCGREELKY